MRGICQRCMGTIRSGQLYIVYDTKLRATIPICVKCKPGVISDLNG
jgi:hypothetical protein